MRHFPTHNLKYIKGWGRKNNISKQASMKNHTFTVLKEMEGVRRTTGISFSGEDSSDSAPDPEVSEKAVRWRFTAESCAARGDLGVLLRREGLYSSHLTAWRRQRDERTIEALSPKKRGPKEKKPDSPNRCRASATTPHASAAVQGKRQNHLKDQGLHVQVLSL